MEVRNTLLNQVLSKLCKRQKKTFQFNDFIPKQDIHGQHMATHGKTQQYMAIHAVSVSPCNTWEYMAVHDRTQLYMAVHGNTWLYMAKQSNTL